MINQVVKLDGARHPDAVEYSTVQYTTLQYSYIVPRNLADAMAAAVS